MISKTRGDDFAKPLTIVTLSNLASCLLEGQGFTTPSSPEDVEAKATTLAKALLEDKVPEKLLR